MKISKTHNITKDGVVRRNPYNIPVLYHGSNVKFDKFSLAGINTESTDQEGVGIYLTDDFEDAQKYGKYVYVVDLISDKRVPLKGSVSLKEIMFLINNSPDKETGLSNYAENLQVATKEFLKINQYQRKTPHQMFQTMWYEFYRYNPKQFIINMTRLGYDYVKVRATKDINHYIVYNFDRLKILNVKRI